MFLRVTHVTGVGRTLKYKKLMPHFIGPYQIFLRVREVVYRVTLPLYLSNLHDAFHVSQIRKYIHDPPYEVQLDGFHVRENLKLRLCR